MKRVIQRYIFIGIAIIFIGILVVFALSENFSERSDVSDENQKVVNVNLGKNVNVFSLDEEVLKFEEEEDIEIDFSFLDEEDLSGKVFGNENIYLESIFETADVPDVYKDEDIAKINFISLGMNNKALENIFVNPENIKNEIGKISNKKFIAFAKKIDSWILNPRIMEIKLGDDSYTTKSTNEKLTGVFAFSPSSYEDINRILSYDAVPYLKDVTALNVDLNNELKGKISKNFLSSLNDITNNMAALFAPGIRGDSFAEYDYYSNENIEKIFMEDKALFTFVSEKTYNELLLNYKEEDLNKIKILPLLTSSKNSKDVGISNIYTLKVNDDDVDDKNVNKVYEFLLKNLNKIKSPFEKQIGVFYENGEVEYIYNINIIKEKKLKEALSAPFLNRKWDFEDLNNYINALAENINFNE